MNCTFTANERSAVGVNVTFTLRSSPGASVPSGGSHAKKPQSFACSSGRVAFHSAFTSFGFASTTDISRQWPT